MSYWLYQHLGNLAPRELDADPVLAELRDAADGEAALRAHAVAWDHHRDGSRWSHSRLLGRTKLIVLDSREGRTLDEGRRRMFDDVEWDWIRREVAGDFDHVVLADTLPMLMPPAFHHVEAWNEAVCAGAWGAAGRRLLGERLRRGLDLEHWAAFRAGFERLAGLLAEIARGDHGPPPATVVLLGGDIHHAYLARAALPGAPGARSGVFQAVCSPFRNPLDHRERVVARIGCSRRDGRARAGTGGRRPGPADPLAPGGAPDVRQPGRDAGGRRPPRARPHRADDARRVAAHAAGDDARPAPGLIRTTRAVAAMLAP
jgi:hypothetical protein